MMKYLALILLWPATAFSADPIDHKPSAASCRGVHRPGCPAPKSTGRRPSNSSGSRAATSPTTPGFLTGQAARITIGQATFTSQDLVDGPNQYEVGAVSGLAYANNTLFVVDSNKIQATPNYERVLIYDNISQYVFPPTNPIPQQGLRCAVCVGPYSNGASVVVGEPDFVTATINLKQAGLQTPTAVASDGQILVVADTDNNRVLIWKTIPAGNGAPADIVLGQPDFVTSNPPFAPTPSNMRGPQGVWIQGTRLFVADTQNDRVMVWNNIPTTNNQPADYVLGEPNLKTAPAVTVEDIPPQANNLWSPVSVTSDGQRLFVTDLSHSRVLIWNSIPTANQQPADVVIGQPDMVTEGDNNVLLSCVSNGTDSDNNPTYPAGCTTFCPSTGMDSDNNPVYPFRCGKTLSFPRFALSDGQRLYIADGGNDRVLIYNSIPTQNGQEADEILGQVDEFSDQVTDNANPITPDVSSSSPNTIRTPMALAWDGANLYVSDPFDRRVLVFTLGLPAVPIDGIVNAASQAVYALGTVDFAGTITATDTITITINGTAYAYKVVSSDTLTTIVQNMANLINGTNGTTPDPNVIARTNPGFSELILVSKVSGPAGDNITLTAAVAAATSTSTATETATASGGSLTGGQNSAQVGPGTLITITGTNLSDTKATGKPDSNGFYPTTLGGVQVYFDGIQAPLLFVSPTQINAQIPYQVSDASGISSYTRTVHNDGTVTSTVAISVPIVGGDPGIFAAAGSEPRAASAFHTSSNGIGIVSVDGSIVAGDTATISIEDRSYSYTVQSTDNLETVRDGLVALINANPEEKLSASPSSQFTRVILTAKIAGPDGDGIAIGGTSTGSGSLVMTALNTQTCCASVAGAPITPDNPAVPGEVISIYATGIGLTTLADNSTLAGVTGQVYNGPAFNTPETAVDNAQIGNTTANVLSAGLKPGMLGVYEVQLQLDATLPTNLNTQLFIAQNVYTSNIVTIPVVAR